MFFLPVMLLLLSGGFARVVQDFQRECGKFFAFETPPTVFPAPRFRQICQTLNNVDHYATLYDTLNKIPVYSAYVFTGWVECERSSSWYIEPQLENPTAGPNMFSHGIQFDFQASNLDYIYSDFDKGHLAPVYHANSQQCSLATFTLTNAAPQNKSFNRGQWKVVESNMKDTVYINCKGNTAYIVTGVVPGNRIINNRVRVPSHFWTAYCCENKNIANQLISGGVIGNNSKNEPAELRTVIDLENNVTNLWSKVMELKDGFQLFSNNCRVADYVPVKKRLRLQRTQDRRFPHKIMCGKHRVRICRPKH